MNRKASFSFLVKLVDVETASIKFAKEYKNEQSSKACEDDRDGIADGNSMLTDAKSNTLIQFKKDVAPFSENISIELIRNMDESTGPVIKQKHESALAFASADRMDRACEIWKDTELVSANPPFSIIYHSGVCSEIDGDFKIALEKYKAADKLLTAPVSAVSSALKRVAETLEQKNLLRQQLNKK